MPRFQVQSALLGHRTTTQSWGSASASAPEWKLAKMSPGDSFDASTHGASIQSAVRASNHMNCSRRPRVAFELRMMPTRGLTCLIGGEVGQTSSCELEDGETYVVPCALASNDDSAMSLVGSSAESSDSSSLSSPYDGAAALAGDGERAVGERRASSFGDPGTSGQGVGVRWTWRRGDAETRIADFAKRVRLRGLSRRWLPT